jgi:radical SAM/Cys-rich protein
MGIKQASKTLQRSNNPLADTLIQLEVLNGQKIIDSKFEKFRDRIGHEIRPLPVEIFQINIGKLCNQTCAHCHVDAGPDRKVENMDRSTLEMCLNIIIQYKIPTVDITGGAPEMNPNFRWFVEEVTQVGVKVIDRCNLTIIKAHEKYSDLPSFFAKHNIQIVSSLPSVSKLRTDSQRGDGVFEDSIAALQMLNEVGYGQEGTGLQLDLVYNPSGAYLPGDQKSMELEFKRQLSKKFGIVFNNLYAITNLPISRFLDYLLESGNYEQYMSELVEAFNPATVDGLMCRNTLSISWDGYIYDCDFNQMLDLKVASNSNHISNFNMADLMEREIIVNQHCYGCTAGAGSSCGGEIT